MHVITYLCREFIQAMLVKGAYDGFMPYNYRYYMMANHQINWAIRNKLHETLIEN